MQQEPLTPQEQEDLKNCEAEIKATLDKYKCDIQGLATLSTGNIQINCIIMKVRNPEAPKEAPVGASAASAPENAASAA